MAENIGRIIEQKLEAREEDRKRVLADETLQSKGLYELARWLDESGVSLIVSDTDTVLELNSYIHLAGDMAKIDLNPREGKRIALILTRRTWEDRQGRSFRFLEVYGTSREKWSVGEVEKRRLDGTMAWCQSITVRSDKTVVFGNPEGGEMVISPSGEFSGVDDSDPVY